MRSSDNFPPLGLVMKAVVVILTLSMFWKASHEYFSHLANNHRLPFLYPFVWELTGHASTLLLIPLIYLFIRRFPIRRPHAWAWILLHVAASLGFSLVNTTVFNEARLRIYEWFDLGEYGYGNVYFRYLYEFQVFLLAYWSFYGALLLYTYVVANREREGRTLRLEAELNQARLDVLKTQMNPHFLFNTLNTISSVMYENAPAADRMISLLGQMLRRTLDRADRQVVPLCDDLELLELYLEIMRARFGDRLSADIDIAGPARNALVPSFLLQPLVENSLKFNRTAGTQVVAVRVRAAQTGHWLELAVEDNGPGLPPDFRPGTGLSNLNKRLEYLYGEDHEVKLQDRPEGGLRVTIRLPFSAAPETGAESESTEREVRRA
ncbi:MAG: sensor histidine kinase [Acidobacteriota bacterium]